MSTELKSIIKEMSDIILKSTSVVGTEVEVNKDSKPYEQCLGVAGVTLEQAKTVRDANRNFAIAATHALGQQTLAVLAANPDLTVAKATVPMIANDAVSVTQHRERVYPNPQKPEETLTVIGALSMSVKTNIGKCAEMKQAMELVQAQAAEMLKKE